MLLLLLLLRQLIRRERHLVAHLRGEAVRIAIDGLWLLRRGRLLVLRLLVLV